MEPITTPKKIPGLNLIQPPSPPPSVAKPKTFDGSADEQALNTKKSEGTDKPRTKTDPSESEVARWLRNSKNPDQRRERFNAFLHSLWPSDDDFNGARHPFYNPKEDGLYKDFIKYEVWDGDCPYYEDDYDPFTDPARSTEVWQPQIGDEGIENEEDLYMVSKARQEHAARSRNFNKRKDQVIKAYEREGVKYEDMDMTRVLLGPEIESDDSDSEDEAQMPKKTLIRIKVPNTATELPMRGKKGGHRGRPKGSRNKPKSAGSAKKRKRVDSTYKDEEDSEDEEPVKKKGKKGKKANIDIAAVSEEWKEQTWRAQTRAAARRAHLMNTDGSFDEDDGEDDNNDNDDEVLYTRASYETDLSSDQSSN
ncbi:hypothetical protein F4777DRAFT_597419 [Nemania sp. FL0916]|nr:hypothetical protein F4777DRAFT_597419 [Nemania sp. FL0916]